MTEQVDRSLEIVAKQANIGASFVPLNVRGTRIYASRASLMAATGSYFPIMLQDRQAQYFLDVDPTHFHRILGFLQHGTFSFVGLNEWEIHELRAAIAYLHLSIPNLTAWAWAPSLNIPRGITLKDGNTVVVRCGLGTSMARGDTPVMSFQVQFNLNGSIGFVGLAPREDERPSTRYEHSNSLPVNHRGYYFSTNGTIFGPGDTIGRPYLPSDLYGRVITPDNNKEVVFTVELRPDNAIHFAWNEHALGRAFDVPSTHEPLFPTVGMARYSCIDSTSFVVIA
ncbi:Aste57867_19433 [Aphanomyces stellatus]|uniref:Aste57867_19433 protein n=1 Tax=Aphanomyces stellatus TaxID=120398 RepID=A0A485LCQ8_9STRA|nr:hypothetical protein As57867_019369 [Aphanomyces stellatus]VFT96147.1 Aste57867_19433 [Aphanomyces stellatus]